MRPDVSGTNATWNAAMHDEEYESAPTDSSASETRDSSTASVLDAA